jgi:hypothetical protein
MTTTVASAPPGTPQLAVDLLPITPPPAVQAFLPDLVRSLPLPVGEGSRVRALSTQENILTFSQPFPSQHLTATTNSDFYKLLPSPRGRGIEGEGLILQLLSPPSHFCSAVVDNSPPNTLVEGRCS